MDPHANIVEAETLARNLLARLHSQDFTYSENDDRCARLCELVLALHEWRMSGGFDPYEDPNAPVADPQANALLERVKRAGSAIVNAQPGDLPHGYLYVIEEPYGERPFHCGIAPDGSVSS
jgi:hypothetical protein